jgi:ribosomal protein S18 acetylase RimI-like enzyme
MWKSTKSLLLDEWQPDHPNWAALVEVVTQLRQEKWAAFSADWHLSSHMLVAHRDGNIVGFLRYVIQQIGVEDDLPPVTLDGEPLTEAKVLAFGVAVGVRRQGIGRRLQQRLIADARRHGCHQIRSHSSAENEANHRLKLALGFAIQPLPANGRRDGAYFLLPLQGGAGEDKDPSTETIS